MVNVLSRERIIYSLREFTDQKAGVRRLLSLPSLQHHVLRACNDPQITQEQLLNLIKYDPTLIAKILNLNPLNNSTPDIQARLSNTPVAAIKQVLLSGCAERYALYQGARTEVFDFIKQQWVISLQTAFLARSFAYQFGYSKPDQAFYTGIIHNIGKLLFQSEDIDDYFNLQQTAADEADLLELEKEHYGFTHPQLGGFLAGQWGLDTAIQDAIQYHHTDIEKIQDAHPLTRIIYLARCVAESPFNSFKELILFTKRIFNVAHAEFIPLVESALTQTGDVISSLHINVPNRLVSNSLVPFLPEEQAHSQLQETAKNHQLMREIHLCGVIDSADNALAEASQELALQELVNQSAKAIYGVSQCLFFKFDRHTNSLQGTNLLRPDCVTNEITIKLQNEHSLLTQAFNDRALCDTFKTDIEELSIIDRELINHTQSRAMLCAPLIYSGGVAAAAEPLGVLVLGFEGEADWHSASIRSSVRYFTHKITHHLTRIEAYQSAVQRVQETEKGLYTATLKRMVHEINNPLSIAQNNIHIMGVKHDKDTELKESLLSIQGEITRAADLLKKHLDATTEVPAAHHPVNINELISDLLIVFKDGFLDAGDIVYEQELDQTIPPVYIDESSLKQILTNLVKNAAESMDDGGWMAVHTFDQVIIGNQSYIEIQVQDNGPGVPQAIVKKLFAPVESSKGMGHSGLGLSIVKELAQKMGGFVSYRRTPGSQTIFSVCIPRTTQPPEPLH